MRLRHRNQMWIGHRIPPAGTVTPPVDPCVANLSNDQIAYWDADSIPNTDDIAGRVMAASGPVGSVAGKIGNAWRFEDSPGPFMTTPDAAPLRLVGTDFTIRLWVRFIILQGLQEDMVTKFSDATFSGWGFRISATDRVLFILGNGGTLFSIDGNLQVEYNLWYHVVTVFNLLPTPSVTFYLNAAPRGMVVSSQFVMASDTSVLGVGPNPAGGSNGADMEFDEFGIWGFPWTQCEVTADFNSGAGRTHPFV